MILPTKHLSIDRSLLGVGADVLSLLEEPKTVSRLWGDLQERRAQSAAGRVTFDWFVLSLDLLHAVGAVENARGRLARRKAR